MALQPWDSRILSMKMGYEVFLFLKKKICKKVAWKKIIFVLTLIRHLMTYGMSVLKPTIICVVNAE